MQIENSNIYVESWFFYLTTFSRRKSLDARKLMYKSMSILSYKNIYKIFDSITFLFPRKVIEKLTRAIDSQKDLNSKIVIVEFMRATRARNSIKSNEYVPKLIPLQHHYTLRAFSRTRHECNRAHTTTRLSLN